MLCGWRTNRTRHHTFSCSIWLMWCWRCYWGWIPYCNLLPIGRMLEIMLLNTGQVWWTAITSVVGIFSSNMWPPMCSMYHLSTSLHLKLHELLLIPLGTMKQVPFQLNLVVTPSLLPKNWSPNMQMFQHQVTTRYPWTWSLGSTGCTMDAWPSPNSLPLWLKHCMFRVQFPWWPQELYHLWFSTSQTNCVLLKAEHVIDEKKVIKVNFNIVWYTCIWITHTGFHTNIIEPVMLYCDRSIWQNGGIALWWWLDMCTKLKL